MIAKPRLVEVTDPREVAVIREENTTGALGLPRGGFDVDGRCWAYADDLRHYRATLVRAAESTALNGEAPHG